MGTLTAQEAFDKLDTIGNSQEELGLKGLKFL